jgi:hypothetical protein
VGTYSKLSYVIGLLFIVFADPVSSETAQEVCLNRCSSVFNSCMNTAESVPLERRSQALLLCAQSMGSCANVGCKPQSSTPTSPRSQNDASQSPQRPQVSDACLSIGQSTMSAVCSSAGEHWYFTMVRASGQAGCPKDVFFTYMEKGKGQGKWATPFSVQTCGGPPQNIHAIP